MDLILAIAAICQISAVAPSKEILNNTVSYQKSCQVYLTKCIIQERKKRWFPNHQRDLLKCIAYSELTKI